MLDAFRKIMDLLDAQERRRFWLLMVLTVLMGVANMAGIASIMPFLAILSDPGVVERNAWLSQAYAFSGADTSMEFLLWVGAGVVLAYLGGLAFKAVTTYALLQFGQMRHCTLSVRVFDAYLAQPYPWFLRRHSADLAKNVLGEVSAVVNGVLTPFLNMMANAIVAFFLTVLLILVDPIITLFVALLLGGGYALIFLFVRRRLLHVGEVRVRANRERYQTAQEGLTGIKEVKVLGLESSLSRRFKDPARRVAEASALNAAVGQIPRHLMEALAFGGMMVVVLVLAVANGGDLSKVLPLAGVYAIAGSRLAPALQEVFRTVAALRFATPALDALHADFMAAPAGSASPPAEPIRLRDRLTLEGVDYAYPGAERGALRGFSLDVSANSTVGLVGGTGAGKTTAIDVVMGLLEPQAGALIVDGRPIRTDAERRAWRRSIGYVPQQIFLVDDTITANIAFGLPPEEVDHEAVERAARMAELHRFVTEELPQSYATAVGDRGVRLSGGQRQRIGIARALYHDPDVLVLDEATSALDNLTEQAVMEAVNHLGGEKTVVMIAHRLSTVRDCDRIFLLEQGRVASEGTYGELLERSALFRDMAAKAVA